METIRHVPRPAHNTHSLSRETSHGPVLEASYRSAMKSSMMRLQKNAGRWRPRSFLTAAPKSLITDAVSNLDESHNRSLWWLTGRSSLVRGLVAAAAAVDGCRRCDEAWLHSRNNNITEYSPTLWRYRPQICYQAMLLTAGCFSAAPEQVRNW